MSEVRPGEKHILASDSDREAAVARLGQACGQGRLSLAELTRRIEEVYLAEHLGQLDVLLADLPARPPLSNIRQQADELLAAAAQHGITRGQLLAILATRS